MMKIGLLMERERIFLPKKPVGTGFGPVLDPPSDSDFPSEAMKVKRIEKLWPAWLAFVKNLWKGKTEEEKYHPWCAPLIPPSPSSFSPLPSPKAPPLSLSPPPPSLPRPIQKPLKKLKISLPCSFFVVWVSNFLALSIHSPVAVITKIWFQCNHGKMPSSLL